MEEDGALLRGCGCRGSAGHLHLKCIVDMCMRKNEFELWQRCPTCHQKWFGNLGMGIARQRYEIFQLPEIPSTPSDIMLSAAFYAEQLAVNGVSLPEAEEVAQGAIEYSRRRNLPGLTTAEREIYTVLCTDTLAQVYKRMGRYADALPLAQYVLARERSRRNGQSSDDHDALAALGSVANLHLEMENYDQAAPLLQECVDGLTVLLGSMHQSTLGAIANLAQCFAKMRNYTAALPLAQQSLKGFTTVQGGQHPNAMQAAVLLDEVATGLGSCASEQPRPGPAIHPVPGGGGACAKCGAAGAKKVCSRCKGVCYCSRDCQKADWKQHKKQCKVLAAQLK